MGGGVGYGGRNKEDLLETAQHFCFGGLRGFPGILAQYKVFILF